MKLFLISQSENTGYDTYDSVVVVATNIEEARRIHPDSWSDVVFDPDRDKWMQPQWGTNELKVYQGYSWASHPSHVRVEYLGEAAESVGLTKPIICASFNAG
jgi:hypothetical protein